MGLNKAFNFDKNKIFEIVGFIANILEIILSIVGILKNNYYVILIFIVIIQFIIFVLQNLYYKKEVKNLKEDSLKQKDKFEKEFKLQNDKLKKWNKELLKNIEDCNNFVIETYYEMEYNYKKYKSQQGFINTFTKCFKEYTNKLAEIFKLFTDEDVTVTIRVYMDEVKTEKGKLLPFAFSQNCDIRRVEKFKQYEDNSYYKVVEQNTDFLNVISSSIEETYFYEKDVTKIKNFKSQTANYEKFYRGRIVIPIRMDNKLLFYTDEKKGYEIIGFLTLDTKSSEIFIEKREDLYIPFLKSQAEILYMLFKRYQYYISKEEKRDESK